jgi:CheY-like chemotaxis protein
LIKQSATKKRLRLSFSFDSAVKDILADERRLKQILINLLSNAVKFTPEGGAVGLEVRGDEEAQTLHFMVWDRGIGIAKENFQRLFKPFTQLDSRLSREYNGTGLGLTLVHRLTELHGGGVSVTSEFGQGSRFTVSLPWHTYRAQSGKPKYDFFSKWEMHSRQPKANILPPGAFSHRILLAEDNEAMLRTIYNYLQAKKYAVIVARNGNEAIARTLEEKPDLILMDIQMPVCDGLEAIKRIRANEALNSIPIIALTALAMPGDRERCLQAGANDYLAKPVRLKRLVTTIEQHLTKRGETREILSRSTSFILGNLCDHPKAA